MLMHEKGPLLVDARRLETSLLELSTVYNARTGHVRLSPLRSSRSFPSLERFSYDLEIKTRETKQKHQPNGNRAIYLVYRTDTEVRFFWLVKRALG